MVSSRQELARVAEELNDELARHVDHHQAALVLPHLRAHVLGSSLADIEHHARHHDVAALGCDVIVVRDAVDDDRVQRLPGLDGLFVGDPLVVAGVLVEHHEDLIAFEPSADRQQILDGEVTVADELAGQVVPPPVVDEVIIVPKLVLGKTEEVALVFDPQTFDQTRHCILPRFGKAIAGDMSS